MSNMGLYAGASYLNALENWQSNIAGNLANSSSPGFRKSSFEVSAYTPRATLIAGPTQANLWIPEGQTVRNHTAGEIRQTGNPFDLAVQGAGMFAVRAADGSTLYTRDGEFHINSEGTLVNKSGFPVMAEGRELNLRPEDGQAVISEDGSVSQGGQVVGRVSVYEFRNPEFLQAGNGSLFGDPTGRAGRVEVENPVIRQGHIESSNVVPMAEMVSMIQASRAYEMTRSMIQSGDDMSKKAIEAFSV